MKKLALFDFDGTISSRDSMFDFAKFAVGSYKYYQGLIYLLPSFIKHIVKITDAQQAKQIFLSYYFGGFTEPRLKSLGLAYSEERIDQIIRPTALQKILCHLNSNHDVYVVSASCDIWLSDWCAQVGVKLISTRMCFEVGCFAGKIDNNCNGMQKKINIQQQIDLTNYDWVYVYGDSKGDNEMFTLGDETNYKPF